MVFLIHQEIFTYQMKEKIAAKVYKLLIHKKKKLIKK